LTKLFAITRHLELSALELNKINLSILYSYDMPQADDNKSVNVDDKWDGIARGILSSLFHLVSNSLAIPVRKTHYERRQSELGLFFFASQCNNTFVEY
jgi:hypothetical protein